MAASPSRLKSSILAQEQDKSPLFFFDFDGTLTRIAETPGMVRFTPIARFIVEELARNYTVGVVSGRALKDVRRLVGIKGIFYSGNHGVEIEGPGLRFVEKNSAMSVKFIESLAEETRRRLRKYRPLIQSKKYSVAVHYRTVDPRMVGRMLDDLGEIVSGPVSAGKIKLQTGKKVVEIKSPTDWDKGKAIERIVRKSGRHGRVFFFGDDMTDEFGFQKVNELKGVSVFVGTLDRRTAAKYMVESPSALIGELAKFLFGIE
jgi:trehalose 6-phosphate phosphatase